MNNQQANYLGSGARLKISSEGLERHGIDTDNPVGTYVSQFESPKMGRLVIVHLDNGENYGFQLGEIELLGRKTAC